MEVGPRLQGLEKTARRGYFRKMALGLLSLLMLARLL